MASAARAASFVYLDEVGVMLVFCPVGCVAATRFFTKQLE